MNQVDKKYTLNSPHINITTADDAMALKSPHLWIANKRKKI